MDRLCRAFATHDWPAGPIAERIFAWPGDVSPAGDSVPLRLAGALHALRLMGDATLVGVYPPATPDDETFWTAIAGTLTTHAGFIDNWLDSPPQTNEVRRSAAIIPVGHLLADRYGLPMRTSELGASGGLNLMWDHYALQIGDQTFGPTETLVLAPDWTGPLPSPARPQVASRAGVDLNPLDPNDPEDARRLQAYLWPDQPDRMALTNAAIAISRTPVAKADAIDWLAARLSHQPGTLHLIYHTVAWQYFPTDVQAKGAALIEAAGALATDDTPLAWFGMENDRSNKGAALTLRLWPGDVTIVLGRADFHGRWINWTGA